MVRDRERCSFCGAKKLREPKVNDVVYLVHIERNFAGMLAAVLKQNSIPYLKQGRGFFGPVYWMKYDFYVPFGAHEKAKELYEELFSKEEIAEGEGV